MTRIWIVGCLVAGLSSVALAAGEVVFEDDFEADQARAEWSHRTTERAPNGHRRFLGRFCDEEVRLKIADLPRHDFIRITIDLLIIQTWDGAGRLSRAGRPIGPDVWQMAVEGGPLLVRNTFSNINFGADFLADDAKLQSYPSPLSGERHPATTGAFETGKMGYTWQYQDNVKRVLDSAYRVSAIFPHRGEEVELVFKGDGLQSVDDESWGLDNVKVEAFGADELERPTPRQMAPLWEIAAGGDPERARSAFWTLVLGGDSTVEFLRTAARPGGADAKAVQELVGRLDDDSFEVREEAARKLASMGVMIRPVLREAAEKIGSAEARLRVREIMSQLGEAPVGDERARKAAMALRLLEVIATPEAARLAGELGAAPTTKPARP